MAKGNGLIWKWIIGIFVTVLLAVSIPLVGVIFAYGGKMYQVEQNAKIAEKAEQASTKNKEDIIGIKKDVEQVSEKLEEMSKAADKNTKAIIEAINRMKDGN